MDQAHAAISAAEFARICVFCGSSSGKTTIYTEVAQQLGSELVKRGIHLVYGGGSIGLMGTVAQAVHDAGGHVVGVIPKALMPKEICGATVGDLVAVDDMHQRKAEMARRADAFIALPGGFGTFEEVLEIITWAQLGIHKKPVGLLNVDGYYDALLALFDKALEQGFLNQASRDIVVAAPTAAALLDNLKNYVPTVDRSVPELAWETATGESATSKAATQTPTTAAALNVDDPAFHMDQNSAFRARAPRVRSWCPSWCRCRCWGRRRSSGLSASDSSGASSMNTRMNSGVGARGFTVQSTPQVTDATDGLPSSGSSAGGMRAANKLAGIPLAVVATAFM